MTNLLIRALEALRKLPPDQQDFFARALLDALPDENGVYILSPEERESIERSEKESTRGEFVPDEEVEAYWRSLGL
jgi:hypothetical protein